jgi:ribose 1,5-bisphosphokinase PhnN
MIDLTSEYRSLIWVMGPPGKGKKQWVSTSLAPPAARQNHHLHRLVNTSNWVLRRRCRLDTHAIQHSRKIVCAAT